jgi:hypothetical protein
LAYHCSAPLWLFCWNGCLGERNAAIKLCHYVIQQKE